MNSTINEIGLTTKHATCLLKFGSFSDCHESFYVNDDKSVFVITNYMKITQLFYFVKNNGFETKLLSMLS